MWDKAYVIYLAGGKNDIQRTRKHLADSGVAAEWVQGINLTKLPIKALPKAVVYPRVIGCNLSHYMVWQHVALSGETALIMEDDVVLCRDFHKRVAEHLERVPAGWEWVQLGWLDWHDRNKTVIAKNIVRTDKEPFGFHCYLLTGTGANKLVKFCNHMPEPVDIWAPKKAFPHMKWYLCCPSLAHQVDDLDKGRAKWRCER